MKLARSDYDRSIQDPANLIPVDEPVFLIRAQDANGPAAVRLWAWLAQKHGAAPEIVDAALAQAKAMREWQLAHGSKTPDLTPPEAPAGDGGVREGWNRTTSGAIGMP